MTLSHLLSTLLSANDKLYSLYSSGWSSFTTACRAPRPASLSLKITMLFCTVQPAADLRSLVLTKGFLGALATNTASWAGLDTCCKPVPWGLPTCLSLQYFCRLQDNIQFPCDAAINPPASARAMMRPRINLSLWATVTRIKKEWLDIHTPH